MNGHKPHHHIKRNSELGLYACLARNSPSWRIIALAGWSILLIDLLLHHSSISFHSSLFPLREKRDNSNDSSQNSIAPPLPKDRSDSYKVKILPSMDDDALELLPSSEFSHIAMIDAGSSGCRVHVYRFGKVKALDGPLYILPKHVSMKVKPGLSSFAKNPLEAGATMAGLVDFVKSKVPEADWGKTPIWLKATAGLRMLHAKESEAILESVRGFLGNKATSPLLFRPQWASIIPGVEEGAFGWIAYNYLKRIIGPKKEANIVPYAVIEMGGASAQVTQLAPSESDVKEIPEEYRYTFIVEGQHYTLYTHSYLGYGSEQAREATNRLLLDKKKVITAEGALKDPCLNAGFTRPGVKGTSVYEGPEGIAVIGAAGETPASCLNLVKDLFPAPGPTCAAPIVKSHSFGCVYQPKFLAESLNFLVFENYFYTASGIGLLPAGHAADATPTNTFPIITSAKEMEEAAESVCSTKWDQVNVLYPKDGSSKDSNIKFCFVASVMTAFLVNGLGIDPNKQLTIQQSVGNSDIEWALGAAYKEAADFLKQNFLRGSSGIA